MDQYDFNAEFQEKILSLMIRDRTFMADYGELIEVAYFTDEIFQNIAFCCVEHFREYGCSIDKSSVQVRLALLAKKNEISQEDLEAYCDFVDYLYKIEYDDAIFVKEQVKAFARNRAMKIALRKCVDFFEKNELQNILPEVITANNVGLSSEKEIELFSQYQDYVEIHKDDFLTAAIPTGIPLLDKALNGGLKKEELGIIIGQTSSGKSMALIHMGKVAAVNGFNVCHITNELAAHKVADRYASCLSGTPYSNLFNYAYRQTMGQYLHAYGEGLGSKIWIKRFIPGEHTIYDYKAFVTMLINKGNNIDLLVIDHLHDVGRHTHRKDDWAELRDIVVPARGMAGELHLACWTAAHIRKEEAKKEVIDVYGIGESKRIGDTADVVLSLNADPEEAEAKQMRIFVAKNRDGERFQLIKVRNDYSRISFFEGAM